MQNVKGFFDLCVNHKTLAESQETYDHAIKVFYKNGYRTIAINYVVIEPQSQDSTESHSTDEKSKKKRKGKGNNNNEEREEALLPKLLISKSVEGCEDLKILHRLTIHMISKAFYEKIRKLKEYNDFQIIAIFPLTATAFTETCKDVQADILTMLPAQRNHFHMQRKHYNMLVSRGLHLELLYAAAITDDTSRRDLIILSHDYHLVGRSRNVIVSSGCNDISQIRNPYDVINLGIIFGLSHEQCKMAVLQNCRNVYYHAVANRQGTIAMIADNCMQSQAIAPEAKQKQSVKMETAIDRAPEESTKMETSVIEIDDYEDDDDEVTDVGHQLKKIKTNAN